jgi:hypothetical protein
MLTKYIALLLFISISFSVEAQKYKRSNEVFDFSFTKEGKMKVVLKPNMMVLGKSLSTLEANNEIILTQDQYSGTWNTYADGKMGDSIVKFGQWSTPYKFSYCFIKKDGQLIYSEKISIKDDPLMVTDPSTGESIESYDDFGNPMYDYSTSGGLVEKISLKEGKSIFKKEGYSLMNLYGEKLLLIKTIAADGALWNNYTLTDWKGTNYFEDKNQKDIYANENYLSLLVNQTKAEKIIIKNDESYFDSFGFIANGKMGYSSIGRGVMAEADKDFQMVGDMHYYYDNNLLNAKIPESILTLSGKESVQSVFYAHDYYTEYFVDGKVFNSESNMFDREWKPSFSAAETFAKMGNCLIYSKPYMPLPDYDYEGGGNYQPSESALGSLVIYDLEKKQIIFNKSAFTFLNYTDKGFLIQKISLEMKEGNFSGNLIYTYFVLDKSGKILLSEISKEDFQKNPATMLSLLPSGATEVCMENSYMGNTLVYALNGKIGVFGENNTLDRLPINKWRLSSYQGEILVTNDKLFSNDTLSYIGNKPYCNKSMLNEFRNFLIKGNKKKVIDGLSGKEYDLATSIEFGLIDTNFVLESIEFKENLVIQNVSSDVRAQIKYNYDYATDEISYNLNANGDTLMYVNAESRSGIYDFSTSKWLVPAKYFRVIPFEKYFIASYFDFLNENMTKSEFIKVVSNPKFVVFDLKGVEIVRGSATEVKKKIEVDVKNLQYEF